MIFTPNSWGSPVAERWSDAARAASLAVRRAKAKARGANRATRGYLDFDQTVAHKQHGVPVTPVEDTFHASHLRTTMMGDPTTGMTAVDRAIRHGVRGKRTAVLSALRHEVGHVTDDTEYPQRQRRWGPKKAERNRLKIAGATFSPKYGKEIAAWKNAVRDAPHNRVDWRAAEAALATYLQNEPAVVAQFNDSIVNTDWFQRAVAEPGMGGTMGLQKERYDAERKAYVASVAAKHTQLLRRYGRRLRRQKTDPTAFTKTSPAMWQEFLGT